MARAFSDSQYFSVSDMCMLFHRLFLYKLILLFQGVSEVFPPTTGGAKQLAETFNIDFLGSVDLDPRIGIFY